MKITHPFIFAIQLAGMFWFISGTKSICAASGLAIILLSIEIQLLYKKDKYK